MSNYFDKQAYAGRIGGKITFAGVLFPNFRTIFPPSSHRESTYKKYAREYINHILPHIGNKPIEECTEDEFISVLQKIESIRSYKATTVDHFRFLMSAVVEFAVKAGECGNVLYGSKFHTGKGVTQAKILKNEVKQNRKSLTPEEEVAFLNKVLLPPDKTTGTNVGLLLMCAGGLRNQEACGPNFESIRPREHSRNTYDLWIYESTIGTTSDLQASGKTKNMARKIPLSPALAKYLLALKAYRQQQINNREIVLEKGESLETLPIVWMGNDFKKHCTSRALTVAGKKLLSEINFAEDRLLSLQEELEEELSESEVSVDSDEWISLKDPTAYLLRRNFGTHLSILGCSDEEIAYLMGHKIETEGFKRNMFSNEDQLAVISSKLNMRPFFGSNDDARPSKNLSANNQLIELNNVWGTIITADSKVDATVSVRVSLKEPEDTATITLKKDPNTIATPVSVRTYAKSHSIDTGALHMVNSIRIYQKAYRDARKGAKFFDAF